MTSSHQNNDSDPVNLALGYAFGVLEGESPRAVKAVGPEPSVGLMTKGSPGHGQQPKDSNGINSIISQTVGSNPKKWRARWVSPLRQMISP